MAKRHPVGLLEKIVTSLSYRRSVKVRDVIRTLESDGWRLDRQVGSRRQFRHPDRPGTLTLAGNPSDEVPNAGLDLAAARPVGKAES